MKKLFLLSALFISVSLVSQQSENARKIIDTLASVYFSGRGYVNNGMGLAAEYIAKEYQAMGIKALSGSYYQTFNIRVNTFPGKMALNINEMCLTAGVDYIIDPASKGIQGDYNVLLANAKDLLNIAYLKKLVNKSSGKFLAINTINQNLDDKESQDLGKILQYLKYSSDPMPYVGLIVLTDQKLSWHSSTHNVPRTIFTVHLKACPEKIKKVSLEVESDFIENYSCSNVAGIITGSEVPDSFIVLTAHYDHLGMMGKEVIFPGANDNASGVAMLLNLAGHFSQSSPKYSIVFIALAAEESGLLGAKHFVDAPLIGLEKIKFLINFDLAGTGNEGIKVVNGSVYKSEFERLSSLNDSGSYLPAVKVRGEACNSDHCMFYQKGVPCFYVYTLGGNPAYHDIYDRPANLPLDKFPGYKQLMVDFIESF